MDPCYHGYLQLLHWMLVHDHFPSSEQIQVTLECCSVVLQNPQLEAVIGQKEQTSWVCSFIRAIHQLLASSECEYPRCIQFNVE